MSSYSTTIGSFSLFEIIFWAFFFATQKKQKKQKEATKEGKKLKNERKISESFKHMETYMNSKTIEDQRRSTDNLIV